MTSAIRVLLVDDEPAIRRGLRMRLMLEPDLEIVGEASNGVAAIELSRELVPDVVVMDVRMPVMDGITATQFLTGELGHPAIIVLSLYDDTETITRTLNAGATAFLTKSNMDSKLVDAILRCANPKSPSPKVAEGLCCDPDSGLTCR